MTKIAAQHQPPILAGIFLLKSAKNARFINRCVPGVQIPDAIIDRLEQATDPLEEGMTIAAEQGPDGPSTLPRGPHDGRQTRRTHSSNSG